MTGSLLLARLISLTRRVGDLIAFTSQERLRKVIKTHTELNQFLMNSFCIETGASSQFELHHLSKHSNYSLFSSTGNRYQVSLLHLPSSIISISNL